MPGKYAFSKKFYLPPCVVKTRGGEIVDVLRENSNAAILLQNKSSDCRITFQNFLHCTNLIGVAIQYLQTKAPNNFYQYICDEKSLRYQAFVIYNAYVTKLKYLRPADKHHFNPFAMQWKVVYPPKNNWK